MIYGKSLYLCGVLGSPTTDKSDQRLSQMAVGSRGDGRFHFLFLPLQILKIYKLFLKTW